MRRYLLIAILVGVPAGLLAGDYGLTVADDPAAACVPRRASRESSSWPVRSAAEIGEDIERYFAGKAPALGLFRTAFGNGRVTFCGRVERTNVYEAMIRVALKDEILHEQDLVDFSMMLGSKEFLGTIEHRLEGARPAGAARLRRMKAAAERGMKRRGEAP